MHGWEMMSQTYGQHNWANQMQAIKSEPMEMHGGKYTMEHKQSNDSTNNAPDTIVSLLHATTPASGAFYPDQPTAMPPNVQSSNQQNTQLGYNPLTPPGYPNAHHNSQQLQHHQFHQNRNHPNQQQHQTQQQQHSQNQQQQPQPQLMCNPYLNQANQQTVSPSGDNTSPTIHSPQITDETPPKTPQTVDETPEKDMDINSNSGDEFRSMDSGDEDDIRTPKKNSNKSKPVKCKHCPFVGVTRLIFYEHLKHEHPTKALICPKCPFVAEFKHHLTYHLRKHDGLKPFQCNKCPYSGVNQSMLNSHMKSHSSVYQYHCADCSYATKYCHSLKQHLRKNSHNPGVVLNQDGSPNLQTIIDVYGTRRGPKSRNNKSIESKLALPTNSDAAVQHFVDTKLHVDAQQLQNLQDQAQLQNQQQNQLQIDEHKVKVTQQAFNPVNQQHQQPMENLEINSLIQNRFINMFPYLNFHPMFASQLQPNMTQLNFSEKQAEQETESHMSHDEDDSDNDEPDANSETNGLDLSSDSSLNTPTRLNGDQTVHPDENSMFPTPQYTPLSTAPNRRKGRAFKLDILGEQLKTAEYDAPKNHCGSTPPATPSTPRISTFPKVAPNAPSHQSPTESNTSSPEEPEKNRSVSSTSDQTHQYECKACGIAFKDAVLHTIHMGYHGFNDVFKCNMCGTKCEDRVSFFLHIARNSHS